MYEGSKYEATRSLPFADVVKLIRADLKAATGTTIPKGFKFRTRQDNSRTSTGLVVTITPSSEFPVINPAWTRWTVHAPNGDLQRPESRYAAELHHVIAAVESIVTAYNHDRSDTMTDYFDVRFYEHVTVDANVEEVHRSLWEAVLGKPQNACLVDATAALESISVARDLVLEGRDAEALRALAAEPGLGFARKAIRQEATAFSASPEAVAPFALAVIRQQLAVELARDPHPPSRDGGCGLLGCDPDCHRPVLSPSACRPLAPFPQ